MTQEESTRLISAFESRHPELTVTLLVTGLPPDEGMVARVFDRDRPSTPKWEGQGQTVQEALNDVEEQMDSAQQDGPLQEEKEFLEEVYRELHEER